jgi:hypothetical protein
MDYKLLLAEAVDAECRFPADPDPADLAAEFTRMAKAAT